MLGTCCAAEPQSQPFSRYFDIILLLFEFVIGIPFSKTQYFKNVDSPGTQSTRSPMVEGGVREGVLLR